MKKWAIDRKIQYKEVRRSVANRRRYRSQLRGVPAIDVDGGNVLFVVVDCLRADHTWGYERETTPFLSDVGMRFTNAFATAPWTYPSVVSLLTGRYPHTHGATFTSEFRNWNPEEDNRPSALPDDLHTLSELYGKNGYETFLSTAIRTAEVALHGRFARMNTHFHDPAAVLVDDLLEWWEGTSGPKFGYLQFGDLHGLRDRVPDGLDYITERQFGQIEPLSDLEGAEWDDPERRSEFVEKHIRAYDTALRYVDGQIERLFSALSEMNELDRTLVVIVGDHGEAFGEHWTEEKEILRNPLGPPFGYGHGTNLFQELIHVPLWVVGAGADGESADPVSLADVVPTVLDHHDVSGLDQEFDGTSLLGSRNDRPIHAGGIGGGYEQHAVIRDGHKYIHHVHEESDLLFDLTTDPDEQTNLIENEDRAEIRSTLREAVPEEVADGASLQLDDSARSQLEDLGYIE